MEYAYLNTFDSSFAENTFGFAGFLEENATLGAQFLTAFAPFRVSSHWSTFRSMPKEFKTQDSIIFQQVPALKLFKLVNWQLQFWQK